MPAPTPEPSVIPRRDEVVAVVLAGGASRRFGAPKADVAFDGVASLARIRQAAATCVDVVATVGGPQADVADLAPGEGPLQAIAAAFRAYPGRDLCVLACDVPLITPAWIQALIAPLPAASWLRVPRVAGQPQPLAALWGRTCAPAVEAAWARGERALLPLVRTLPAVWLEVTAAELALTDFDTPEAAAELRARHAARGE